MDSGSGSRWPTGWLLSLHHIIQHIHVARLGSVPPRRARTFVGQTAGCRTKVHLAPVRRRVQFQHWQRAIFLSKRHLRNKKSWADSPLQYYEDLRGLKNAVVGHARPPEDTGNQPLKTALPCGQMDSNRHMTACIFDGEEISPNKYFRIYRFPEFWKYLIGFCWFQAKNFKCNMCFS